MLFQSELYPQIAHYRHQIDTIQTPIARHYNYQIYYNDLPVFQAYKQVHIFKITGHQLEQNNWPIKIIPPKNISDANAFLLNNDSLIPVLFTVSDDSLFWHNTESGIVLSRPVGNNSKDTFATVKVFKPNPINSSGKSYFHPFKDNNDQHAEYFNREYFSTRLPLIFDRQYKKYQPSGKFIIKEISPPYLPPTNWLTINDTLNRSHFEFEDANALFHLHLCDSLVTACGYGILSDTLFIDTHALNGADQSIYKGIKRPASIEFGTGGVDDAEDGEVVAHEFAHGLSARATHAAPIGVERNCIEEGWADYFAKRYSGTFIHNQPNNRIFSWDAHNEFWEGYFINTNQNYHDDVLNANSTCRQVWSSALNCIQYKLGTYADTLLFELLFYHHDYITMPQLAEWLIKIDSLYASAKNYASIKSCFVEYGILARDTRDIEFEDKTSPLLVNSFGFTYKGEPLEIQFGQTKLVDIGLYTSQGKMIYEQFNQIGNAFSIDSKNLSPGFYYLTVYSHTNNKYYTFKLIKQ